MQTFKDLLNDKMNWKLINMIMDMMMKYEDKGYTCIFNVAIPRHSSYIHVYVYITETSNVNLMGWRTMVAKYTREEIIEILNENGWIYQICIIDKDEEETGDGWMDNEQYALQTELVNTGKLEFIKLNDMQESEFKEK